jgi:MGT family glycosyltransferase
VPWNEPGAPVPASFRERTTRPRVYVTLGTIVFGAVEVIRAAVHGLAKLGAQMVVAVGPEGDPAALGSLPPVAQAERFVDQAALLPHLDVVVSHCGSGTMLGALAYGLPQLALPQGADQFRNAEGVVDAGVGLRLLPHEITAATVAAAVHDLLDDPRYRAAATRVRDQIAAMPSPDAVVPTLAELASGL